MANSNNELSDSSSNLSDFDDIKSDFEIFNEEVGPQPYVWANSTQRIYGGFTIRNDGEGKSILENASRPTQWMVSDLFNIIVTKSHWYKHISVVFLNIIFYNLKGLV